MCSDILIHHEIQQRCSGLEERTKHMFTHTPSYTQTPSCLSSHYLSSGVLTPASFMDNVQ